MNRYPYDLFKEITMGRPLHANTIIAMDLTTEQNSKLGKQVGFNKYLEFKGLDEKKEPIYDADKIICLAEKDDIVNGINYEVLNLNVKGEAKPVTKILRNLVHTADGVFAYQLIDGKVVFADANVSFAQPKAPKTVEVEEPKVQEPKVQEPKAEEPKEGEE